MFKYDKIIAKGVVNMKKILFRLMCVTMCLTMIFSSSAIFSSAEDGEPAAGFTAEDMLTTKGKKIVNKKGEQIILRGINLGGWLIQEDWFCPVNEPGNITTLEVFTERFGQDKAYELMNQYEDNWITEEDLDNIVELGFNCVRVPFWYRNFYYDDKGTKILDENGEWDFSRLDWIISECKERRLYVILDMHGTPGYQSNAPHSGKANSCGLFKSTKEAEEYRKITAELWKAIAERYYGEPAIAMYDLLNEPMCDVKSYLIKNNFATISMYNRLYNAIRSVDGHHTITVEAIWRLYNVPAPYIMGWKNVVYQLHLYNKSNFEFKLNLFTSKLYPYNVPIFIGEFKPLGTAKWDSVLSGFNSSKYSWTVWTYKGYGYDAAGNDWYVYGSKNGDENVDIYNDSYETIMQKWDSRIRTDSGNYEFTGLQDTVRPYL